MNPLSVDADAPVLLTGATGLLGRHLHRRFADHCRLVPLGLSRQPSGGLTADLAEPSAADALLATVRPGLVIHAAALADVDACEGDPARAWRLNVQATALLADALARHCPDARLIHISTDQVHDGPGPHGEDAAAPANVYALTKLWAEEKALALPGALVLRTNFFCRDGGLAGWALAALETRQPITLFDDILFNPLYVDDLADMLAALVRRGAAGRVNLAAAGPGLSKGDFIRRLAAAFDLPLDQATAGASRHRPGTARRPRDMRLSTDRLAALLGHEPSGVDDGIRRLQAAGRRAREAGGDDG